MLLRLEKQFQQIGVANKQVVEVQMYVCVCNHNAVSTVSSIFVT